MTKSRATQGQDRGSYLRIRDDLDPEDISEAWPAVISKGPEYEVLPFLIEHQNSGQHRESRPAREGRCADGLDVFDTKAMVGKLWRNL
jgi:hypothetical protein